MKKEDIRKEIQLKLRNLQHREEKNNLIFKELISNRDIEKAENIMCFVSFRNEVDTHKFIKHMLKNNKNIYIPIIDSKNKIMNISKLKSFDELEKGFYGNSPKDLRAEGEKKIGSFYNNYLEYFEVQHTRRHKRYG